MNLTAKERERLLSFVGYGNPQAPIWFLGMEEGTGGDTDRAAVEANIRTRAQHFKQTEDLVEAHRHFGDDIPTQRKFTQVWLWMAKLVRGLEGEPDWPNTEKAKSYVRDHLGRKDGNTLLVELLPLPSPGINHWPYETWWATRDHYMSDVLPNRITMLQELIMNRRPRIIFAYGSRYHGYYKQISGSSSWKRLPTMKAIEFTDLGETLIVTMPFFGNGGLSTVDAQVVLNNIHEQYERTKIDEIGIPSYMKSTFDLLQCAFAEGLSDREYRVLVAILKTEGGMTLRAVADAVALLGYKDYYEIYNDALGIHERDLSRFPAITAQIRQRLNDCGYQSWLEED